MEERWQSPSRTEVTEKRKLYFTKPRKRSPRDLRRRDDAFLMLQRFKRDGLKLTGWRNGGELSGFRLFHGRICIENSELFRPSKRRKVPKSKGFRNFPRWQGQKDLNPRHSVLETDALPTELYPYMNLWWTVRDSNPGPTGYEPAARPTELAVRF